MIEKIRPRVGLGIIIENSDGNILIGKRINAHAPYYSIPGGSLEMGETFEEGVIRETKEETNLTINNPKVIGVTNNLDTFKESGLHFISIVLHTNTFKGELINMEPHKCENWFWCNPNELPIPHFDASQLGVECFIKNKFYVN